jgi:hypothetical protein
LALPKGQEKKSGKKVVEEKLPLHKIDLSTKNRMKPSFGWNKDKKNIYYNLEVNTVPRMRG